MYYFCSLIGFNKYVIIKSENVIKWFEKIAIILENSTKVL
jgi:hypothetical protein